MSKKKTVATIINRDRKLELRLKVLMYTFCSLGTIGLFSFFLFSRPDDQPSGYIGTSFAFSLFFGWLFGMSIPLNYALYHVYKAGLISKISWILYILVLFTFIAGLTAFGSFSIHQFNYTVLFLSYSLGATFLCSFWMRFAVKKLK